MRYRTTRYHENDTMFFFSYLHRENIDKNITEVFFQKNPEWLTELNIKCKMFHSIIEWRFLFFNAIWTHPVKRENPWGHLWDWKGKFWGKSSHRKPSRSIWDSQIIFLLLVKPLPGGVTQKMVAFFRFLCFWFF